jgi:hypothetical protein
MLAVYFDESGTHDQSDVLVVAGWISTDVQWQRFAQDWTDILKAAHLDVFHATDYEAMSDWNREKKIAVRQRLVATIRERTRVGIGVAVVKKPYADVASEGVHPDIPVGAYAVLEVVKQVRQWLMRHGVAGEVRYFFEDRPEKRIEVEHIMKFTGDARYREAFQFASWGWIPKAFPPAQAADMLAYEIWKECVNGVLGPSPRLIPMRRSLQLIADVVEDFLYDENNTWKVERQRRAAALAAGKPWPS